MSFGFGDLFDRVGIGAEIDEVGRGAVPERIGGPGDDEKRIVGTTLGRPAEEHGLW